MKNLWVFPAFAVMLLSCGKINVNEDQALNWNGYFSILKMGEQVHTLWAGQNINIGTVTYGIDDSANFYAHYDCSASGWMISETHLFAGDRAAMPLNKPGAPKIGLFPYGEVYEEWTGSIVIRVPLADLPPAGNPGFVVAAHCIAHSPGGLAETAWAEGDYTFSDKGWGWYDDFYFNGAQNPFVLLYATALSHDSLKIFHLDLTQATAELMVVEYVDCEPGTYDATAYDPENGLFFFADHNTNELWVNRLNDEGPSFSSGFLGGIASSADIFNAEYYYVSESLNTINKVSFDSNWLILAEQVLDTIPCDCIVNDIAMDPAGDRLFIMEQMDDGHCEMACWDTDSHLFYSMALSFEEGAQVAYGSDGELYAVAPLFEDGPVAWIYSIDTGSDSLFIIHDEIIIIDDPFVDLAGGPGL